MVRKHRKKSFNPIWQKPLMSIRENRVSLPIIFKEKMPEEYGTNTNRFLK